MPSPVPSTHIILPCHTHDNTSVITNKTGDLQRELRMMATDSKPHVCLQREGTAWEDRRGGDEEEKGFLFQSPVPLSWLWLCLQDRAGRMAWTVRAASQGKNGPSSLQLWTWAWAVGGPALILTTNLITGPGRCLPVGSLKVDLQHGEGGWR